MTILQAVFLGFLQGLSEFIPISSSGHLVLAETWFKISFEAEVLNAFDVFLHAGSLLALLIYFRKTWFKLANTMIYYFSEQTDNTQKQLLHTLILATIPIIVVALCFKDYLDEYFRHPLAVSVFMFITGLVFLVAEKYPAKKNKEKVSIKQGVIIGLCQAIALIPGISRSGSTISAGMLQGINRHSSAEFSFIMGTIAILAATSYVAIKILLGEIPLPPLLPTVIGFTVSFVVSWFCINFLLKFLKKHSLHWFAFYLLIISTINLIYLTF